MSTLTDVLAALAGVAGLAAVAGVTVRSMRRPRPAAAPDSGGRERALLRAAADAFDQAVIVFETDRPTLVAGEAALAQCAAALGAPGGDAPALLAAIVDLDPAGGPALRNLESDGRPCDLLVRGPAGDVRVRGRTMGALALVGLSTQGQTQGRETGEAANLASLLETSPYPAFMVDGEGRPTLVPRAWREDAAEGDEDTAAASVLEPGVLQRGGVELARQALAAGEIRERTRWTGAAAARRAWRSRAAPLDGGGAVVWSWDVTAAEGAVDTFARQEAALAAILGETADAVAMFGTDQKLSRHNPAFARLWDLEPAWLAERPSHGALLDRLRQRRRLPETADYGRFRAQELARHARIDPAPEAIWRVAGERMLKVLSLPHPDGGLILMFSDITPEVRLKSQFNHLIQVQQATLDSLTDAVAVFGPDARLKLRNEAFGRLWGIPREALANAPAFDDIVERCVTTLHDMHFWSELKGRITDPDPGVRAAARGEAAAADGRRLAWQSRPLPDGATLVSFLDVTDTRRLEGALRDREAALDAAEQLKRDFVGSVSYELRTPLTTILGYAELLETGDGSLSERARAWVGAVREAAADLARSVEDILAFAEIDAGEMTLGLVETDVAALLTQGMERWRSRAAAGAIALAIEVCEGQAPGTILADGESLTRVLDHLIEHALRQTPAGGQVTLSARRAHGEVCLEVADSGRGIPFHVQAHIFDRFSGEEGAGAGAGLGLALVKALVELHGGWVAVESEPGAGAVFACHLPETGQSAPT